jgi:hypothetical protein
VMTCPSEVGGAFSADSFDNKWPPGARLDEDTRSSYSVRPAVRWVEAPPPANPGYFWPASGVLPKMGGPELKGRKALVSDTNIYIVSPNTRHRTGINVGYTDFSATWVDWKSVNGPIRGMIGVNGGVSQGLQWDVATMKVWEEMDKK